MMKLHIQPFTHSGGRSFLTSVIVLGLLVSGVLFAQLSQSGGPGSTVTANQGTAGAQAWKVDLGSTTANATAIKVDGSAVTQPVSGTVTVNALPTGSNLIGFIKVRPTGCTTAGTSDVVHDTIGVATGAGTSVSAATGCVEECYVNNITNSAVTLRLADKAGTPVIWVGGNTDFSIPANSNLGCGADGGLMVAGISFTSGITAIAGTASALNLHLVTRE